MLYCTPQQGNKYPYHPETNPPVPSRTRRSQRVQTPTRFFAPRGSRRTTGSGRQRDCAKCDSPALAMVESLATTTPQASAALGGGRGAPLPLCKEHLALHNQAQIAAVAETSNWNAVLTQDAVWNRPTWPAGNPSRTAQYAHAFDSAADSATDSAEATDKTQTAQGGYRTRRNATGRNQPRSQAEVQALATLGLDAAASPAQIRRRYRRLIKKLHPDSRPRRSKPSAREEEKPSEKELRAINSAWQELKPLLSKTQKG